MGTSLPEDDLPIVWVSNEIIRQYFNEGQFYERAGVSKVKG
jgi:hypothetical protein